jgi:hypothetical protein
MIGDTKFHGRVQLAAAGLLFAVLAGTEGCRESVGNSAPSS